MRGHIVKRYKNSYTIVLNLGTDPATGNRKQQWISVKGNKKEAEKRLAELLHQLDTGTFMKPGKTTLGDYLRQWLRDYCRANLAPRTVEGYESIGRCHLIPSLGQIPLTQLKPEHLHMYILRSCQPDSVIGPSVIYILPCTKPFTMRLCWG